MLCNPDDFRAPGFPHGARAPSRRLETWNRKFLLKYLLQQRPAMNNMKNVPRRAPRNSMHEQRPNPPSTTKQDGTHTHTLASLFVFFPHPSSPSPPMSSSLPLLVSLHLFPSSPLTPFPSTHCFPSSRSVPPNWLSISLLLPLAHPPPPISSSAPSRSGEKGTRHFHTPYRAVVGAGQSSLDTETDVHSISLPVSTRLCFHIVASFAIEAQIPFDLL